MNFAGFAVCFAALRETPLDADLVYYPEDYVYNIASDYADKKRILDNVIVFEYFG